MKDIPVFTTENGVASLTLREIPYRKIAYVKLQASQSPMELLSECVDFCRVCGAETVIATGHGCLESFPPTATVLEMTALKTDLPTTDAALFPVLPETLEQWRRLYNEKMCHVPNAAYMTEKNAKELLNCGDGYFVHRNGELLGIGRASADTVDMIAGTKPGAGQDVLAAMASVLTEDLIRLTVAAENFRAMRLYRKLGFTAVREISRWYRVFGQEENADE